ncbi:MAG: response regulator [Myxococcales bacterium]|nr:response regulator [Myxococcales bacterium]
MSGFLLHGVQHYTGVVRDITARKKLEDQFRQAHKMEAFGQLAGGVAHDFNNLLTVILGETEVLASAFPADSPLIDSLNAVYDAGQRATGLTKQLLAFSRRTVLEPRVLDLNEVVRETERMLRRLIGEDIRLSTRLVPNLRHVNVDASQLSQVLMNLAVNARDAMPKGGSLDLETQNVFLDEEQARPHGIAPGPYVQLSVRDSGSGMSANVRARIFQPFFTTKSIGKGTGLGLAVVHGVVTQSGGAVSVESVEGAGTTFHIWLPVAASSAPAAEADDDLAAIVAPGPLLVVEDDDAVRKLALRALAAKGYDVRFARDGAEALDVIEQSEPFALIITDVVMPNTGGMDLSREVAAKLPDTKFLYVSGYTDDVLLRSGIETDRVEFLTKPYTPTSLVHAVRRALAAKASIAA